MSLQQNLWGSEGLLKTLQEGGVAVIPTDTIYGIVGKASDSSVVERIYRIRKRAPQKPCIILISDIGELEKFSITLSVEQKNQLEEYWSKPDPVSIVLDCPNDRFTYLHRGTHTLAFRMPHQEELRELLRRTGPIVAPSANTEGMSPAQNIEEAKKYFGDSIDMYIDGGDIQGNPSKIIKLHKDGSVTILRE